MLENMLSFSNIITWKVFYKMMLNACIAAFIFYIQIISFQNTDHDFNYSHQFIFIKKESDSSACDLNCTISVSFILERPALIKCAMPSCIQFDLCLHSKQ